MGDVVALQPVCLGKEYCYYLGFVGLRSACFLADNPRLLDGSVVSCGFYSEHDWKVPPRQVDPRPRRLTVKEATLVLGRSARLLQEAE